MTTTAFDKAFGTTELCLSDKILKVHDAVPNRDKRQWELLSKSLGNVTEGNLEMLAVALGDAARERFNRMFASVSQSEGALTVEQARRAVLESEVGSTL